MVGAFQERILCSLARFKESVVATTTVVLGSFLIHFLVGSPAFRLGLPMAMGITYWTFVRTRKAALEADSRFLKMMKIVFLLEATRC